MQYEESLIFPIFLNHYRRFFSAENIFVIDHGSKTNLIPDDVNRIYVPRNKPFSEVARLDLIQNISKGLLNYYDLGVYADCDELISFECVDFDSIVDEVTYVAGFEVFQGKYGQVIGALNPLECKPLIFKTTPVWGLGFHSSNIKPSVLSIPMAHIRYFDREIFGNRLIERQLVYENMDIGERDRYVASHWAKGEDELSEFYSFLDSNQDNIASAEYFLNIPSNEVFNKFTKKFFFQPHLCQFYAKGDYKIFDNKFFNLTNYFPTLI
jgi:hypothetical protein